MENIDALQTRLLGNPLTDWGIALAVAAGIVLLVASIKPAASRRLNMLAARTHTRIDDAVVSLIDVTRLWIVAAVAVYLGSQYLELTPKVERGLDRIFTVAAFLQLGFWLGQLVKFWLGRSRASVSGKAAATSLSAVGFAAQLVVWAVVVLLAMDNMGINVTALVAGLGVGGVAVALAVQNVLGDLFASLSIVIDKPFVEGDFIIVEDYMGTVENIGLKTTRVRGLGGEQIIFSNSDLLKARVRNAKRQYERRVVLAFGVFVDTSPDQLEKIPGLVRLIIESQKQVRFERAHFAQINDAAMRFEAVYWILDPDYNLFMDIQQTVNLRLVRELAQKQVRLAIAPGINLQPASQTDQSGNSGQKLSGSGVKPEVVPPSGGTAKAH